MPFTHCDHHLKAPRADKINTARFTFNGYYTNAGYRPQIELADLKKLGFADNYYAYTPDFPLLNVTGFFQASIEQIKISRDYNTLAWSDDFRGFAASTAYCSAPMGSELISRC